MVREIYRELDSPMPKDGECSGAISGLRTHSVSRFTPGVNNTFIPACSHAWGYWMHVCAYVRLYIGYLRFCKMPRFRFFFFLARFNDSKFNFHPHTLSSLNNCQYGSCIVLVIYLKLHFNLVLSHYFFKGSEPVTKQQKVCTTTSQAQRCSLQTSVMKLHRPTHMCYRMMPSL